MNSKKPTVTFPGSNEDFSSLRKAEQWCKENGYSHGVMCNPDPIGIKKGDFRIAKWKNLSPQNRDCLDGTMESFDWRNGDVFIILK